MSEGDYLYTAASVARDAAERIRWEMELGAVGYVSGAPLPKVENRVPETLHAQQTVIEPPRTQAPPSSPSSLVKSSAPLSTPTPSPLSAAPADSAEDPALALNALRQAIGDCTRCNLHRGRTNLVFGDGNPHARLVFVGEGPGMDEDLAGRPFVGAAGQLLDRIIEAMGLSRQDVYICNVVKCRPPKNRTPAESEAKICGLFLKRQLAVIRPKVIVALGAVAAGYLLGGAQSITRIRGRFQQLDGTPMMPTFHPAYLLRNPSEKRAVWNDMQQVMGVLGLERKKP